MGVVGEVVGFVVGVEWWWVDEVEVVDVEVFYCLCDGFDVVGCFGFDDDDDEFVVFGVIGGCVGGIGGVGNIDDVGVWVVVYFVG